MTTFVLLDGTKLSRKEIADALEALMVITQERDGKDKARKYADGRRQCSTISKAEAASPTCSPEAISITAAIETHDVCGVAVIDITR